MTVQQKPILHGRDHACGGADPVPGICLLSPGTDIDDVLRATGVGAFWKLDEPSGTVAHDSSGNSWDLNVPSGKSPPAWGAAAGPPGTPSAHFQPGVADVFARTASPSFPAYSGDLTAAGWVNLVDSGSDAHFLMGQGNPEQSGGDGWAFLVGGTLTLWAALCGTPWQPSAAGKILFFEDLSEAWYRIDRMVTQLLQAGARADAGGRVQARQGLIALVLSPSPHTEPCEDHAAYIANWLDVLTADNRAIFAAASHAQRAADFINGLQPASAG